MAKITIAYQGNMLFEAMIGKHKLTVDVPPEMGGLDRGPIPPQLFIASLGSCVGELVVDYCRRTDIDTEGLSVEVDFEKASQPTRLTNIHVVVRLPNADCSEQRCRDALLRVAAHCPVHETIETVGEIGFDIVGQED